MWNCLKGLGLRRASYIQVKRGKKGLRAIRGGPFKAYMGVVKSNNPRVRRVDSVCTLLRVILTAQGRVDVP
jgi:hypothetical protein